MADYSGTPDQQDRMREKRLKEARKYQGKRERYKIKAAKNRRLPYGYNSEYYGNGTSQST